MHLTKVQIIYLEPFSLKLHLLFIGIVQALLHTTHESLRGSLSLLVALLLIGSLALGETSLGLDGEFSLLSVIFAGSLIHLSDSNGMGV